MTLPYEDTEFTSWILQEVPDFIIEFLSTPKINYKAFQKIKMNKNFKLSATMRKKKIITIVRNKNRLFDFHKQLQPTILYSWAQATDLPDDVDLQEIITNLYEEHKVDNVQQLATQLYFAQEFDASLALYSLHKDEPKKIVEKTAVKASTIQTPKEHSPKPDKQLKKLMKEIEKKKNELSEIRQQTSLEIKDLKIQLNDKKTELFTVKKDFKEMEEQLKVCQEKLKQEVELRQQKEDAFKATFFKQLDAKDLLIKNLQSELDDYKNQINFATAERPTTSSNLVTSSDEVQHTESAEMIDPHMLKNLEAIWKNGPQKEEGYSVIQAIEEPMKKEPAFRAVSSTNADEQLKIIILGNPRNSTLTKNISHQVTIFERHQNAEFIAAITDCDHAYLYEPRYLPEEFSKLATPAACEKAQIIRSFNELKQTMEAL
ncbi:MAG: hypothetical protein KBT36_17010 [Kurthia sp.]|nr:hypothetical protein [Candidatus Kurthia equi]